MNRSRLSQRLPDLWYRPHFAWQLWALLPLSWVFRCLSGWRRRLFQWGVLRSCRLAAPVIVVGNLTVGGSGKTPFVIWLVERLRERGWQPGIISRGYGGEHAGVVAVSPDTPSTVAGDEPLLLAKRCRAPVYVGRDRVAAGEALLAANPQCNVIVADDGMQHYRLRRCAEVAVFDGRGIGNGRLLPAGPLREPVARLRAATAVIWNSAPNCRFPDAAPPQFAMRLRADVFYALACPETRCTADDLRGRRLHALAGIGDPNRFFAQLTAMGLEFTAHPFPDHHVYTSGDFAFAADGVLLMTEKDAVKCAAFPLPEAWVLPVDAQFDTEDASALLELLVEKLNGCPTA